MLSIIIISFFVVSILGVITHFIHKWVKKGILVHIFSAINESVWEHMKLSLYPMTLIVIIHSLLPDFYYNGYWGVAFLTVLSATMLIPILYYPIRALIGKEIPAISISLYFVCILISFVIEYQLLSNHVYLIEQTTAIILFILLFAVFAFFTYYPPKLKIFKDPIFNKFGEFKQSFDKKKRTPRK